MRPKSHGILYYSPAVTGKLTRAEEVLACSTEDKTIAADRHPVTAERREDGACGRRGKLNTPSCPGGYAVHIYPHEPLPTRSSSLSGYAHYHVGAVAYLQPCYA